MISIKYLNHYYNVSDTLITDKIYLNTFTYYSGCVIFKINKSRYNVFTCILDHLQCKSQGLVGISNDFQQKRPFRQILSKNTDE